MVWWLLILLTCISTVVTWQRQFASWKCQTASARFYFISSKSWNLAYVPVLIKHLWIYVKNLCLYFQVTDHMMAGIEEIIGHHGNNAFRVNITAPNYLHIRTTPKHLFDFYKGWWGPWVHAESAQQIGVVKTCDPHPKSNGSTYANEDTVLKRC